VKEGGGELYRGVNEKKGWGKSDLGKRHVNKISTTNGEKHYAGKKNK